MPSYSSVQRIISQYGRKRCATQKILNMQNFPHIVQQDLNEQKAQQVEQNFTLALLCANQIPMVNDKKTMGNRVLTHLKLALST